MPIVKIHVSIHIKSENIYQVDVSGFLCKRPEIGKGAGMNNRDVSILNCIFIVFMFNFISSE